MKQHKGMFAVFVIGALMIPLLPLSSFHIRMIIQIYLYTMLAMSLNLITGFAGQLSLGHAAFYGIGAYTSALLSLHAGWPFPATLVAAGLMAALTSLVIGLPALKLTGAYLAIVTLGFNEIVRMGALNWVGLTRGPMGLPGIPAPNLVLITIQTPRGFYYLILAMLLATGAVLYRLLHSATGRAFVAIREDAVAAEAMGIHLLRYKTLAFAISALIAGMAGSFYAHYASFIDPQGFSFQESIQILSMVVLGGLGSFFGPLAGAALLVSVPELLRGAQDYRMILHGLVLVIIMLARPQGLLGGMDSSWLGRTSKKVREAMAVFIHMEMKHKNSADKHVTTRTAEAVSPVSRQEVPHVSLGD